MIAPAEFSDLKTIKLTGKLGRRFGRTHQLAVESPAEAVRALCTLFKGFRSAVEEQGSEYRVLVNDNPINDAEKELHMQGGKVYTIAPVTRGNKSGFGQILAGIALIALSFVPGLNVAIWAGATATYASVAFAMGVSMVLGGVVQLLTPIPKMGGPREDDKNTPNTQFNGPVNTQAQGHPVPICYGELIVGSAVISAGLSSGFDTGGGTIDTGGSGTGSGGTGSEGEWSGGTGGDGGGGIFIDPFISGTLPV